MKPRIEIKHGFLIKNLKIFDTKIQMYSIEAESIDGMIIYRMKPSTYKRIIDFENLTSKLINNEIFNLLKRDSNLAKKRKENILINEKTLLNISNMAVIYNYPTKYLTQKKFYLYKSCQILKKRLT